MNKTELVAAVAEAAELTANQADDAVAAAIEQLTGALSRGDEVALVGFGRFSVRARAARTGRSPQTGASIAIAASNQVVFKPGKGLKDAVNTGVSA
ncbi:HU family DNA-binding protein [Marinimicrobium alkaliphilum]|uniref:HU family DNA-binding protein n=1 Tax=Marinimicrobium alkaliphilum TaxID=2202654 RepID=UPI000DBA1040|nr:HU family DNA-binding protein [Marinimicrobium alkaliphilum]